MHGRKLVPHIDQILIVFLYHSKFISLLFRNISSLGIRAVFVARSRQLTVVDRFCLARESKRISRNRGEEGGCKASTVSYGDGRSPPTRDCS